MVDNHSPRSLETARGKVASNIAFSCIPLFQPPKALSLAPHIFTVRAVTADTGQAGEQMGTRTDWIISGLLDVDGSPSEVLWSICASTDEQTGAGAPGERADDMGFIRGGRRTLIFMLPDTSALLQLCPAVMAMGGRCNSGLLYHVFSPLRYLISRSHAPWHQIIQRWAQYLPASPVLFLAAEFRAQAHTCRAQSTLLEYPPLGSFGKRAHTPHTARDSSAGGCLLATHCSPVQSSSVQLGLDDHGGQDLLTFCSDTRARRGCALVAMWLAVCGRKECGGRASQRGTSTGVIVIQVMELTDALI
ncbi:hypothetical protein MRS44_004429 [Fusarium solani]|uniref:uncharacterized protein n=1 Tax=Fusarium solani TaxID=169388 RepID=UPI0032C3E73B|nr:hypothetical protein MRS44_004429 [Fusarium solani]